MKIHNPKHRWQLTKNQTNILILTQALRFTTTDILAELLHKDRSTIYERLSVLEQQGFIIKQYNSSYRIRQRPATYCLDNAGIRVLIELRQIKPSKLRQHYKDKSFSEEKIDNCLRMSYILLGIRRRHEGEFRFHTQYQFEGHNYIKPAPLLHAIPSDDASPEFLIDFIPATTMSWIIRKRTRQHEDFADDKDSASYPYVLFVAGNASTEKRIVNLTKELYNDFKIYTTRLDLLLDSVSSNIWQDPVDSLGSDDDEIPQRISLPNTYED